MRPIYTAFFTKGTRYEAEANRLRRSLDRLGLDHDIEAIDDRGSWEANAGYTATHIATMQARHALRPIVQLDADAVVWEYPHLFESIPNGADIAVHYRRGSELLNGTVWLAPTEGARQIIGQYQSYVARAWPRVPNEQRMLQTAIAELSDPSRVFRLPASYCFIHDIMSGDLLPGERSVIEHLQASREDAARVSPLTENRKRRVAEIAALNL